MDEKLLALNAGLGWRSDCQPKMLDVLPSSAPLAALLSVLIQPSGKGEKAGKPNLLLFLKRVRRSKEKFFSFPFGEFAFQSKRLDAKCSEHSGLGESPWAGTLLSWQRI